MNLTRKAFVCINKWREAESLRLVGRTRTSNIKKSGFDILFVVSPNLFRPGRNADIDREKRERGFVDCIQEILLKLEGSRVGDD